MADTNKDLYLSDMAFKFSKSQNFFFRNVSLHFGAGKIHFIQGANGSGKSTFFNILQGTMPSDSMVQGTCMLNGHTIPMHAASTDSFFTRQVAKVAQKVDLMLVGTFTVKENLQFAQLPVYPSLRRMACMDGAFAILDPFGIQLTTLVDNLSGGQRQLVAIVMALQKSTKLLLLDEPTSALDPHNAHMVMKALLDLARQFDLIVLIITHDKELVTTYAQGFYVQITQDPHGCRTIEKVSL